MFVVYLKTLSKYQKAQCSRKDVKGSFRGLAAWIFCDLSRKAEESCVNSQAGNRRKLRKLSSRKQKRYLANIASEHQFYSELFDKNKFGHERSICCNASIYTEIQSRQKKKKTWPILNRPTFKHVVCLQTCKGK